MLYKIQVEFRLPELNDGYEPAIYRLRDPSATTAASFNRGNSAIL